MLSVSDGGNFRKGLVNRNSELDVIGRAFDALSGNERLIDTPIIDFFGVVGIGKTSILRKIREICIERDVPCISVEEAHSPSEYEQRILEQIKDYVIDKNFQISSDGVDSFNQCVKAIQSILTKKPIVFLLDAIDAKNEIQINWVETILYHLIDDPKVFVVLASKQEISFTQNWEMSRKLTSLQVRPLDDYSSAAYLDDISSSVLSLEERKNILEWTRGYPLAMNVMVEAVLTQKLDLEKSEDQQRLVDVLIDNVIDQKVLARVELPDRNWYKIYLSLLSVPRRFNLVLLQLLIERFEPTLAQEIKSRLEYMGIPGKINQNTGILEWDMQKTGFTVDESIRNIFLLQYRVKRPDLVTVIHNFLAEKNKEFALAVSGTDRIRYLREYLYHRVQSQDNASLRPDIEQLLPKLIKNHEDAFQFSQEFSRDKGLREILGEAADYVTLFLKMNFALEG